MPQKKKITNQPKQIVYLLGAGATQAEVAHQGAKVNLLMKGISSDILSRANTDRKLNLRDELDIEKLISLLAATGIDEYKREAESLRKAYFEVILEGLTKAGILDNPELAMGLFEMHNNALFKKKIETLSGIISLNHDNLFQVASQNIYKCINLGFKFESDSAHFLPGSNKKAPRIIQLHGSFNWLNSLPINVSLLTYHSRYDKDMLWIPPTILKESKDYPYNKLMALAYEILLRKCNILRIIGCSLSQNDWNIISLIFNAQYNQYRNDKTCFKIELLMDEKKCQEIIKEYSYLRNIFPISQLKDGYFDEYKDPDKISKTSELNNPFKYWLITKVQYHQNKGTFDGKSIGKTLKKIIGAR